MFARLALLLMLLPTPLVLAEDGPVRFKMVEIDPRVGEVCYALASADVNGDGKLDVVAVANDAVVWYENPSWTRHDVIRGVTEKDNVCLQARDVDGDGRVDFALGASWQPSNTKTGGTLQLLTRSGAAEGQWKLIPLGSEPTIHRIRFGDVLGTGRPQLVVAPLQGRETRGPDWGLGQGVRLMVRSVPTDPLTMPWPTEIADDTLHTIHNLQLVDLDGDKRDEILVAAWEGVFHIKRDAAGKWTKTRVGTGNQDSKPNKGASEVKVGRLRNGSLYVATIEPWHGFQVVVYTPPKLGESLWNRRVIDEPVKWGHAVWCADLDEDGDDELIIGQRDPNASAGSTPKGPGVYIYNPIPDSEPLSFRRQVVEDGGVAVEDLIAVDLDNDARPEIVAGGRATHNVRLYLNLGVNTDRP